MIADEAATTPALLDDRERVLPALALIAMLVVLVGGAWLCDDAFITFRTVRNLLAGYGLTWNPSQRVQAYTHPAWMLLATGAYLVSGECFFSILGLATCLTFASVLLLVYQLRARPLWAACTVLLLCCSRAFVEYAVCGLENPLLFLWLVLFSAYCAQPNSASRLRVVGCLFAGIALTRMDAALIVGPVCIELWLQRRDRWAALRDAALGVCPLLVWELFSIVYYGSPVPNTAIAKLNVQLPNEQLFGHGAAYLVDSLRHDPITLTATVVCSLALLRSRQRQANAIVLGILLYVVYLLRIGGDFMSGRFCGALLVFALANFVVRAPLRLPTRATQRWLLRALLAYAVLWPGNPFQIDTERGRGLGYFDVVQSNGIADERAFYYASTGLIPVLLSRREIAERHLPLPAFKTAIDGASYRNSSTAVAELCMVGFFGYFAGDKYVVDRCALTDPFTARIPYRASEGFRPGHYQRGYPQGYLASLTSGRNQLADPVLALLYDRVQRVVTGPLFTTQRWRAIWCLNTGHC